MTTAVSTGIRSGAEAMEESAERQAARLLQRMNGGDREAAAELFPLVLGQLQALAQRAMRGQPRNHTLQPTALLNEAYLKLIGPSHAQWENLGHFLGVAAKAMRSVLVDHARGKQRKKRTRTHLDCIADYYEARSIDTLALHEALEQLEQQDPLCAKIVELRFYGGANEEEIAAALHTPLRTVQRTWSFARAWLRGQLA